MNKRDVDVWFLYGCLVVFVLLTALLWRGLVA